MFRVTPSNYVIWVYYSDNDLTERGLYRLNIHFQDLQNPISRNPGNLRDAIRDLNGEYQASCQATYVEVLERTATRGDNYRISHICAEDRYASYKLLKNY